MPGLQNRIPWTVPAALGQSQLLPLAKFVAWRLHGVHVGPWGIHHTPITTTSFGREQVWFQPAWGELVRKLFSCTFLLI